MNRSAVIRCARFVFILCSIFTTLLHTAQARTEKTIRCNRVFVDGNAAQRSIANYLHQVTAEQDASRNPTFIDPVKELALTEQWTGTQDAPRMVRDTLLPGMRLLNFQLLAADQGVVKVGDPGGFTSFRFENTWKGKNMSTNMGMPIEAIIARTLEGSPYLVPSSAKAVWIFYHGSGTKTTGHHVAAAKSNYFASRGVVTISMDAPFHGYGPRALDLSPIEFVQWLVHFRNQYIPKGVPVFLDGHSGGGLLADIVMRLSDRPDLGINTAFAGLANLSGPIDAAPGKSLAEKAAAESRLTDNMDLMSLVPPAELDLNVKLLMDGKISALGGVNAEAMGSVVNWQMPAHRGSEYLPTLVVMGQRDALYLGKEQILEEHTTALSNTEVHILGMRTDYKGRDGHIGHMIFDHYRPGTKEFETFTLLREFMERIIGQELPSIPNYFFQGMNQTNTGIVTRVVQSYYINLAFRKFADQYEHVSRISSPLIEQMGKRTSEVGKRLKELEGRLKKPDVTDGEKAQIEILRAEMSLMRLKQTSTWIPDGPLHDFATANVALRQRLEAELKAKIALTKSRVQEITPLRADQKQKQALHQRNVRDFAELEGMKSQEVKDAEAAFEESLQVMLDLQIAMNNRNSEMVNRMAETGDYTINPPTTLIDLYTRLSEAYAHFNRERAQLDNALELAIGRGEYTPEAQEIFMELYGNMESFVRGDAARPGILDRVNHLQLKIDEVDREVSRLNDQIADALELYLNFVTPDLFTINRTTLGREMDYPIADLVQHSPKIDPVWTVWSNLWKSRPPEQQTSLY